MKDDTPSVHSITYAMKISCHAAHDDVLQALQMYQSSNTILDVFFCSFTRHFRHMSYKYFLQNVEMMIELIKLLESWWPIDYDTWLKYDIWNCLMIC